MIYYIILLFYKAQNSARKFGALPKIVERIHLTETNKSVSINCVRI